RWRRGRRRRAGAPAGGGACPAGGGRGRVDPEGLKKPPPARRGDDDGVAARHSVDPAEVEAARGDGHPHRTGDVRASLGPIEAESAEVAAPGPRGGKRDAERGEKAGTGFRELGDVVVGHDVFAGDEGVGEIDAEAAREVVV